MKAVHPDYLPTKVWNVLGDKSIGWLSQLTMGVKYRMSGESWVDSICKEKGVVRHCKP